MGRAGVADVQVPSHLMEYFAWDARVLRTFAKHHSTGEPIPEGLVSKLRQSKTMFSALDMEMQVGLGFRV
jgi:intermediate peptidase